MRERCARRGTRRKCRYWMRLSMQLGINLWPQNTTWQSLREHALLADRLGFDSLWVWDQFYSLHGDLHRPHPECRQPQPADPALTKEVPIRTLAPGGKH